MTKGTNDNKPLAVGDRVRRRRFPHVQGYVWDTGWPDMVIIKWDDPEENAYIRNPADLEKITPRRARQAGADKAPEDAACANYGRSLLRPTEAHAPDASGATLELPRSLNGPWHRAVTHFA
jgi:hypothetical protein